MQRAWPAAYGLSLLLFAGAALRAQGAPDGTQGPVLTIQHLFDAMHAGDSAAARRAFVPFGRVLPIRSGAPLTVDQFATYVATIAPGTWTERIWEPRQETFGTLGQVWFEYDVMRGDSISQCGRQSVQLARDAAGWRIVSMAFLTADPPCQRR